MKVLFLTNLSGQISGFHRFSEDILMDCSGQGLDYPLSLLKELTKYADIDLYSPPLRGFITTTSTENTDTMKARGIVFSPQNIAIPETTDMAKLLEGREYDVVLMYAEAMFSYIKNWDSVKTKKALWFLSSPHQILIPAYHKIHADLVLKVADKLGITDFSREFARLGLKTEWLPFSVDNNRFKRLDLPKIVDVSILGNLNPHVYTLRLKALVYLLQQNKYSLRTAPAYGDDYVRAINQSRVFLTCSGIWKYPVMKYFEAMACGVLLFADTPLDAEELGFKANVNYVALTGEEQDLQEKLDYYLNNPTEAEKVAHAGEELARSRHTNEVRARELYRLLEAIM